MSYQYPKTTELIERDDRIALLETQMAALRRFVAVQNILIDQQRMADLMQSPAWEEYRATREALDAGIKE